MDRNESQLRTAEGGAPPVAPAHAPEAPHLLDSLPEDALILIPTRNLVLFP